MANYCTSAELRTQIEKVGTSGSGSDAALAVVIEAASRAIDQYTNRPDGFISSSIATARYYSGHGKPYLLIDDCTAITLVSVKDSYTDATFADWAVTDWQAASGSPSDPDWNSMPYNMLMILPSGVYWQFIRTTRVAGVKVTAKWGYATTPPASIKQAALALSARWYKQGQSAWADTMTSPELGRMIYRKDNVDIRIMLGRYVKPAIGMR